MNNEANIDTWHPMLHEKFRLIHIPNGLEELVPVKKGVNSFATSLVPPTSTEYVASIESWGPPMVVMVHDGDGSRQLDLGYKGDLGASIMEPLDDSR